tara:strand:- start:399 stop:719 length:321 start_codon:yes stop_codon:yes gene_type:complete
VDDDDLIAEITKIVKNAEKNGAKIAVSETPDKFTYIIATKDLKKAVIIGKVDINKIEIVVGYIIDLNKWKWATAEGFTRDQIVDDMSGEVFKHVDLKDIPQYFSSC